MVDQTLRQPGAQGVERLGQAVRRRPRLLHCRLPVRLDLAAPWRTVTARAVSALESAGLECTLLGRLALRRDQGVVAFQQIVAIGLG